MQNYPKHIKKLIRQYVGEAYERELHRELSRLFQDFEAWRSGEISSGELNNRLHQFEIGPGREMYKRYNDSSVADMTVAYSIVTGLLPEEEIPPELLEALERPLNFYYSLQEQGRLG